MAQPRHSPGRFHLLSRAWRGCSPLTPSPQGLGKTPLAFPGRGSSQLLSRRREGIADLFNWDGPTTPDTVHLALGGFFLPVQVSTLSRLEEKIRGALQGPRGQGRQLPTWSPQPSPPPSSWAGPSSGRGRGGGTGKELRPRVFQRVYSYTRHHTEQHRSPSRPAPYKRARTRNTKGARSAQPRGLGRKRREGRGEVAGEAGGMAGSTGRDNGGQQSPEVRGRWPVCGTDTTRHVAPSTSARPGGHSAWRERGERPEKALRPRRAPGAEPARMRILGNGEAKRGGRQARGGGCGVRSGAATAEVHAGGSRGG